jgi:hypothetical protein
MDSQKSSAHLGGGLRNPSIDRGHHRSSRDPATVGSTDVTAPFGRSGIDVAARGIAQGRLRLAWIAAQVMVFADREARR